ncbi:MAG: glutamate synthase central domain-containing protein, partial [Parafannyhessea sp.]|uniref:glutamate synthase central domain-containing protein n=1 Tax=Parafannyhessea sp. TaxID=2847324 RepID=UPI003F094AB6
MAGQDSQREFQAARERRFNGEGHAPQGLYSPEYEHDACGIGALASLRGERSHAMLDDALAVLMNLEHRGGKGLEKNTGDGAGVLLQVPHRLFRREAQREGHILPEEGEYGVAMLFFPQDPEGYRDARRVFEDGCAKEGVPLLFWREVPVDPHDLGDTANRCRPHIVQAFLGRPESTPAGEEFERRLYVTRRVIEKLAEREPALSGKTFYVCSMSARTIVYKGMLVATQLRSFYRDLGDAYAETAIALVHSRYSTNTTPSWERAHPNRYIIHNGEINTLRGNVIGVRAREPELYSPVMGAELKKVMPVIRSAGSDSAVLDNVLEFLVMNGRSLPRAVSLLLPEPWDKNPQLSEERRAFGAYQSMLSEAWDGPAAIAYTDGHYMGAALDRNGLRPARYYVTRDDRLILSSEAGACNVEPEDIVQSGSLGPGQMLLVDPDKGRVIWDDELKDKLAREKPYRDWVAQETLGVSDLAPATEGDAEGEAADAEAPLSLRLARHGYHFDDVEEAITPMATTGKKPGASMGADMPLAVLSRRSRSFFDYFNELFAQVTNPPIDALREDFVTSSILYLGNHGNLLEDQRSSCRLIRLETPILTRDDFDRILHVDMVGFSTRRFTASFGRNAGPHALSKTLDSLNAEVEKAVREGVNIIVLSDRVGEGQVPVPSLLSLGSVSHHLIECGLRMRADIVVETGDAMTPHDYACLVGYGASAIYPYLAHQLIRQLADDGHIKVDGEKGVANYNKALTAGIVSIMSKMGISTMQGYHSAQIFEVVGLAKDVVDRCFTGTPSPVAGLDMDDVQRECEGRYDEGEAQRRSPAPDQLASSGITKWRPLGGEQHMLTPEVIYLLQRAVREGSYDTFKRYSAALHRPGRSIVLSDLLSLVPLPTGPVPLDEVESVDSIVKRFEAAAMSFGAISEEAHETIAIAMNRLGSRSNTGEGGENPIRETTLSNGDSRNSAIKQVASARFGVTSRYLRSAKEIQIKMAQGA